MNFTIDQQKVIDARNCNVLVSAAAGSGKTAVLVERIIGLVTDPQNPIDIDRLLVVTFTKAAAAEMRDRIHKAILEQLEKNPDNANLRRQSILVNHAMITTIDSFCKFIITNHFQEISLDPGFSIGEPGKMQLMKKDALKKVMEAAYAGEYSGYEGFYDDFIALTQAFSRKGQDSAVEEMVESIFGFVMSQPYPERWIMNSLQDYDVTDVSQFEEAPFFKLLCDETASELSGMANQYRWLHAICEMPDGPCAYADTIAKEADMLETAAKCENYTDLYHAIERISFDRLPSVRKGSCDEELKGRVTSYRDITKKRIAKLKTDFFYESVEDLATDMMGAGRLLKPMLYLSLAFMEQFAADKRKENIIDFSDMEHFALQILVDENGNPTETAKWYQSHFATVMIDEYQDSNDVQELLLSVISRENDQSPNRFMVGDMKQSIYKFRMARPEIFLDKYNRYVSEDAESDLCTRIDLKQNFRSRKTVLKLVNNVFYPLMHEHVGGIRYDQDAALYSGATYENDTDDNAEYCPEILLFETTDEEGEKAEMKAAEGEAEIIAKKIHELMLTMKVTDKDSKKLRPIRYDDIVILVRAIGTLTDQIQNTLKREGIPTAIPSKVGYFSAHEIQVLLQFLQVCINPYHDVPLVAVLKSSLFNWSDKELAEVAQIKTEKDNCTFYEKLKESTNEKASLFVTELSQMRELSKTESVHDFLYAFIRKHRYLEYVSALPAGGVRRDNVEMLLEQAKVFENTRMHGLFGFIQYIKQLEKYEIDYGSGNEDSANAVRLMTIHKSKGLEFPVCIIAGCGKKFNQRDLSKQMLLHTDLGIGLEYRNYADRIKRKTIKQKWISRQLLVDAMGEELRVLYVALTRAKEKCILTGTITNYEDAMKKCEQLTESELRKEPYERVLDKQLLLSSTNYLKMILYVLAIWRDQRSAMPGVMLYHESDLQLAAMHEALEERFKKDVFLELLKTADGELVNRLTETITFAYPHTELEGLYNKTSVSELKHAAIEEDEQTVVVFETDKKTQTLPAFLKEEAPAIGAVRGTAYHRLMELMTFASYVPCLHIEDVKERKKQMNQILQSQKKKILSDKRMTEADMELVNDYKVLMFLDSELAKDMMLADMEGLLFKEQPFVIEIPAKRLDAKFPDEETVLIQGIIDAFYEKDGQIYLMDYKTDHVETKEELVKRYRLQLDYYEEAIYKNRGKKVAKTFIYSYHFLEVIPL